MGWVAVVLVILLTTWVLALPLAVAVGRAFRAGSEPDSEPAACERRDADAA